MRLRFYLPILYKILKNFPHYKVIKNYLSYRYSLIHKSSNVSHLPVSVVFYATKNCNLDCHFCHSKTILNETDSELTTDYFSDFLKSDTGSHALRIGFLGGEPFLNKDIFSLILMAYNEKKITTVVTNATLFYNNNKRVEQLLNSNLTALGISLYSTNKKEVKFLVNRIQNKISYWVQSVISVQQIDELEKMVIFAIESGVKYYKIDNCHPMTTSNVDNVIYSDNLHYLKTSRRILKRYSNKITLKMPIPIKRDFSSIKVNCKMLYSYVHADNKGTLGACCMRAPNSQYGNLSSTDFWNANSFCDIRNAQYNSGDIPFMCRYCDSLEEDLYGV